MAVMFVPNSVTTSSTSDVVYRVMRHAVDNSWSLADSNDTNVSTSAAVSSSDLPLIEHSDSWTPVVVQRVATLVVIIAFTLIGNIAIISVLTCSKYRRLQSRVNIFIINLAVGDLTVCGFTMTTEIMFVVFEEAWLLGGAVCKMLVYVQIITLASTTFILTAMSIDRYLAICRPLRFNAQSSRARRMVAVAWAAAVLFALPQLFIFKQVPTGVYVEDGKVRYECKSLGYTAFWQRKLYFSFMTIYILILPTIIISFCYINVVRVVWRQGRDVIAVASSNTPNGRSAGSPGGSSSSEQLRKSAPAASRRIPRAKVRSVKMTLSIIVSFIACWTPYFVVHLVKIWSEYRVKVPKSVIVFAETAALMNSALNPLIYGYFNIKMRIGLMEVFCPRRAKLPSPVQGHSSGGGGPGYGDCKATECSTLIESKRGGYVVKGHSQSEKGLPVRNQRWHNCDGNAKMHLCVPRHCRHANSNTHALLRGVRSTPETVERMTSSM